MKTLKRWAQAMLQPIPLVAAIRLPAYLAEAAAFRRKRSPQARIAWPVAVGDTYPCLADRTPRTPFDPHYFHQGAWIARRLAAQRPVRHVDVGSSVLTLSVLSGFVDTLFIDYRPLAARLPGLACIAGDLARLPLPDRSVASLSCLHVIEHVGLGRYGDPLDPDGHLRAAAELSRVLQPGGRLYLATPVGRQRVCFNAHRVFAPATVAAMFAPLALDGFSLVGDDGRLREEVPLAAAEGLDYGCGLFVFRAGAPG